MPIRAHQSKNSLLRSWKSKSNFKDDKENDTVEFRAINKYIFNPERSNGLTGEEELMVPHPLMLSIVMAALREKPKVLSLVGKETIPILHFITKSIF